MKRSAVVHYENGFRVDDMIRVHDESGALLGIGKATGLYVPGVAAEVVDSQAMICKVEKVLRQI